MKKESSMAEAVEPKLIAMKDNGIGWIVFNNPAKRNALSEEMRVLMIAALEDYAADPAVRVVVVRGAGGKAFVSGGDISQFAEKRSNVEQMRAGDVLSNRAHHMLRECPKPTIAMIQGYCMGGGLSVAVSCDLRIASDDSRFGIPAARLGVGYRYNNLERLVSLIGEARTKEIFYTARQFGADEALRMGLVNQVLPVAELESFVLDYARRIVENAPLTMSAVKQCIAEMQRDPAERDMALCTRVVEACFASRDFTEGRTAFMEKRRPVFQGS